MKKLKTLIIFLFLSISSNLFSVDEYLEILKFDEEQNSIICLAEIQHFTTTEIVDTCSTIKGNCFPAINVKILKFYNRDLKIINNQMNVAFQVDLMISEYNNKLIRQNDLNKEIVFNRKVILSFRQSNCFESYYSLSNIGIAFYINKEPGKSLYKYLEKKYKKNK